MISPVYVIFRNNSFICRMADSLSPSTFRFREIPDLPNIPFYHHIWSEFLKYKKTFSKFFRDELTGKSWAGMILKSHAYVAVPDDMLEFEKVLTIEFFMQTCSRKVDVKPECLLLAPQLEEYIAVSRTCRMLVISHIHAGSIKGRLYLENNEYTVEELKTFIAELLDDRDRADLPIFLNGEDLEQYLSLGTLIEPRIILQNYINLKRA
ncbi:MAG: hypothetical protein GX248_02835 [Peptococcaceae bacterium]|jgi:hypothetical protein|nr:hypothetical protein [Peptococcaceae bacterium]